MPARPSSDAVGPATVATKASVETSYGTNSDVQLYVPVPEKALAGIKGAAARLKGMVQNLSGQAQNLTEQAKNAYYSIMTMVPFSVGMLINVFA